MKVFLCFILLGLSPSLVTAEGSPDYELLGKCQKLLLGASKLSGLSGHTVSFRGTFTTEFGTYRVEVDETPRVLSTRPAIGYVVQEPIRKREKEDRDEEMEEADDGLSSNFDVVLGSYRYELRLPFPYFNNGLRRMSPRRDLELRAFNNQFDTQGYRSQGHWVAVSEDQQWTAFVHPKRPQECASGECAMPESREPWMLQFANLKSGRLLPPIQIAPKTAVPKDTIFGWATQCWVEVAFLGGSDLAAVLIRTNGQQRLSIVQPGQTPKILFKKTYEAYVDDSRRLQFPALFPFERGVLAWGLGDHLHEQGNKSSLLRITASSDVNPTIRTSQWVVDGTLLSSVGPKGERIAIIKRPVKLARGDSEANLNYDPEAAFSIKRETGSIYEIGDPSENEIATAQKNIELNLSNYEYVESITLSKSRKYALAIVSKANKLKLEDDEEEPEQTIEIRRFALLFDAETGDLLQGPSPHLHVNFGGQHQDFSVQAYGQHSFLLFTFETAQDVLSGDDTRWRVQLRHGPRSTIRPYIIDSVRKSIAPLHRTIEHYGRASAVFVSESGPRFIILENGQDYAFSVREDSRGSEFSTSESPQLSEPISPVTH